MKIKIFFLFCLIYLITSCTNPEVEFPKEEKKEEIKNKLIIEHPVLFLYDEPLSPLSFYYIITVARANGASDSMLRPVKYENISSEIESTYQFYGSKVNLIFFGKNIKDKIKSDKDYEKYINKKIFVGNPKCLDKEEDKDITIIKTEEKDECTYEPLNYVGKLKDKDFIKSIIKNIGQGEIVLTDLKEEVILLKGKTFPQSNIELINLDENKKETVIFRVKSDIGGYFGPIILTPRNETLLRVSEKEFEIKIKILGLTNSYSYLELLPEIDAKYIKLIFNKIKTEELFNSNIQINLKDEEKNINIDTIIIKEKGEGYKIDKNRLYIYKQKINEININGNKINIKDNGAYYVF